MSDSTWNESIKVIVLGGDGNDTQLEIETDAEFAYIYANRGDDEVKRDFIGSLKISLLYDVASRIMEIWEKEAKTDESVQLDKKDGKQE